MGKQYKGIDDEVWKELKKLTGKEPIPKSLLGNGENIAKALWFYMRNWSDPSQTYEVLSEYATPTNVENLGREMFFKGCTIAKVRIMNELMHEKDSPLLFDLSEYLTRIKHHYVVRLRNPQNQIRSQSITIPLLRMICDVDYILNYFATGVIVNVPPTCKIPKHLDSWMPFLQDDDFKMYIIAKETDKHKGVEDLVLKGIATSKINNIKMLTMYLRDLEITMNWAEAINTLEQKAMVNHTRVNYSKKDIAKAVERFKADRGRELEPEEAEGATALLDEDATPEEDPDEIQVEPDKIDLAPNMDVKSQVALICEMIQENEELDEPWQKEMFKRMDAKEATPRRYVNNFVRGEFLANMKKVVEGIVYGDKRMPYDVAMDMIGCAEWFYSWVKDAIIKNCYPNKDFYDMVKPDKMLVKPIRINTKEIPHFILVDKNLGK